MLVTSNEFMGISATQNCLSQCHWSKVQSKLIRDLSIEPPVMIALRTTSERSDDIPVLIYWLTQLDIANIMDEALPKPHGNRQGSLTVPMGFG